MSNDDPVPISKMDSDDLTLLEANMPLSGLNEGAYKERYARKGHPRAIKTWWARRPHIAMRGILYGSLVNSDKSEQHHSLIKDISQDVHPKKPVIQDIKEKIIEDQGKQPKLLDFFSGGGVIPYESARLGLDTHSLELNDLGVILQKAVIEAPKRYPDIYQDVRKWGEWVLEKSNEETNDLFIYPENDNSGEEPIVYFYTRTVECPDCQNQIPLFNISSFSKKDDPLFVDLEFSDGSYEFIITTEEPSYENSGRGGNTECPFCSKDIQKDYLQDRGEAGEIGEEVFAVSAITDGKTGKDFYIVDDISDKFPEASLEEISERVENIVSEIGHEIPSVSLKNWSGILNPALYGHQSIEEIFNERQLLVILTVIKNIRTAYKKMIDAGAPEEKAEYIVYILTGLTDHLADWNNRFTMWIPQNEQCGRSLAGPGVPMRWDYIEINPFGGGPANLFDKLDRMVTSLRRTPNFDGQISINQGTATNLPYSAGEFDVIMVDPPYYNSLIYSGLSEFFLPWQELAFKGIIGEFSSIKTHAAKEIIAHEEVKGENADEFYTSSLTSSFKEASRVLKDSGIFIVVYSHKTIDGWASLAQAIDQAGFKVTNVVPLDMERTARPRSMDSDALSSVMNLAMRKRKSSSSVYFEDLQTDLENELRDEISASIEHKWVNSDLLTFVFSKSLELFTKYEEILDYDGDDMGFEQYYNQVRSLLNTIIRDEFSDLITYSSWDIETKIYVLYRLKFGLSQITEEEFGESLTQLDVSNMSDINDGLVRKDGDYVEIPSVISNTDHCITEDQTKLIDDAGYVIKTVLEQKGVLSQLPNEISHSAEDIRHVINLLAGVELVESGSNNNDSEVKQVRHAISKLAEQGNLLKDAEEQQTLADF